MRSVAEIQKVLNEIQPLVNEGTSEWAEIIWDTLHWALGVEGAQNPVEAWLGEDE